MSIEDVALARIVRSRLRWWRLTNICRRAGHFWKELEPGALKCRVCRSMLFDGWDAGEAMFRYLGGHTSTCSYWASNPPRCSCGGANRP